LIKGLLKPGQHKKTYDITIKAGEILKHELSKLSLTLVDFKLEFGFDENEKIYIADEISPDIWRVKDEAGNIPNQIECAKLICERLFA
jgi:phosphoribosylaminoimidazole-succinocarboxamide synthase